MKLNVTNPLRVRQSVVGLHIATDRTVAVLARRGNGAVRVAQTVSLPWGWNALAQDPEKAGRELDEALNAAGVQEKRCTLDIPLELVLHTGAELPEVAEADLKNFIELKAERDLTLPLADLSVAHAVFKIPSGKRYATIVAAPAKRLQQARRMIESSKRRLVSVSLGLADLLPEPLPDGMHLWCNGAHVDLAAAAGGGIVMMRTLPVNVDADSAASSDASLAREMRITFGRLPAGIAKGLTAVRLLGPRNSTLKVLQAAEPVLRQLGFQQFEQAEAPAIPGADTTDPAVTSAFAGARRYLFNRPARFEFLPPQPKPWAKYVEKLGTGRRRTIITAVVGVAVLMLGASLYQSNRLSALDKDWKAIKPQVDKAETQQQNLRNFRSWFSLAPGSLDILKCLTEVFPENKDVWAKTIEIKDRNKVVCSGFARSSRDLVDALEKVRRRPEVGDLAVQQMRGDKQIQFNFSFNWLSHHEP